MNDAYGRLVELALRESALASAGSWDELDTLAAEREALVATLPGVPPAAARAALERAAAIVAETERRLRAELTRTREQAEHVRRGRAAVAGYGRA